MKIAYPYQDVSMNLHSTLTTKMASDNNQAPGNRSTHITEALPHQQPTLSSPVSLEDHHTQNNQKHEYVYQPQIFMLM